MSIGMFLCAGVVLLLPARNAPTAVVDFTKEVKPILERNCLMCHGPARAQAGLRLDTATSLAAGGKGGKVVLPGNAAQSRLVQLISLPKDNAGRMPQEADPLKPQEIATLRNWITQGAKWPGGVTLTLVAPTERKPEVSAEEKGLPITPAEAQAVEKLQQAGVLVLRLAQTSNWLRVDFGLRGKQLKDSELALLKNMPNIVELNLANTEVVDGQLAHVKPLANLTRLQLQNTKITDAGLAQLKGLTKLASLNVYGTGVTDAGIAQLSTLTRLQNLYVWQTKVTAEGATKLAAGIPGITINLGYETQPVTGPKK